jgi:hypothetical protein
MEHNILARLFIKSEVPAVTVSKVSTSFDTFTFAIGARVDDERATECAIFFYAMAHKLGGVLPFSGAINVVAVSSGVLASGHMRVDAESRGGTYKVVNPLADLIGHERAAGGGIRRRLVVVPRLAWVSAIQPRRDKHVVSLYDFNLLNHRRLLGRNEFHFAKLVVGLLFRLGRSFLAETTSEEAGFKGFNLRHSSVPRGTFAGRHHEVGQVFAVLQILLYSAVAGALGPLVQ